MNGSTDVDRIDGRGDGFDTQGLHTVLGPMHVDHGNPIRLILPFLEFCDLLPLQAKLLGKLMSGAQYNHRSNITPIHLIISKINQAVFQLKRL